MPRSSSIARSSSAPRHASAPAGGAAPRLAPPYARAALESLVARYGSPLFVLDCEQLRAQYRRLAAALPGVALHYALKPLPQPVVVATLAAEGSGFDVATSGEIDVVRAAQVSPQRCIHTHPIKRDGDIRDALRFGIRHFVADNPDELGKFVRHRQRAELLLRIAFHSPDAVCDLSRKFGCEPQAVPELLALARRLGVRVTGLSFHVGSQVSSPAAYGHAIDACGALMAAARAAGTAELTTLDIGGGFPVDYGAGAPPIAAFCAPIRAALARLPAGLKLLAEPGRYIAAPAGLVLATVVGRAERDGRWWYYLDDGVYGSFSGQLYDHTRYPVDSLRDDGPRSPSVLAGPTCDSIDVIAEDIALPRLEIGDLLVGRMMGAYTSACASDFNFIRRARVVPVNVAADAAVAELGR